MPPRCTTRAAMGGVSGVQRKKRARKGAAPRTTPPTTSLVDVGVVGAELGDGVRVPVGLEAAAMALSAAACALTAVVFVALSAAACAARNAGDCVGVDVEGAVGAAGGGRGALTVAPVVRAPVLMRTGWWSLPSTLP